MSTTFDKRTIELLQVALKDPDKIYQEFNLNIRWQLASSFIIKEGDWYDIAPTGWLQIQYTITLYPKAVSFRENMGDYWGLVRQMWIIGLTIHMTWDSDKATAILAESHRLLNIWLETSAAKLLWQNPAKHNRFDLSTFKVELTTLA